MPRARNIKAAFFQNEILGSLAPLARLLFIGMWTIADFKGCLEFRPKRIKAQLLPYDECDVLKLAINLDKSGFIVIYSVLGKRYIKIVNFTRHQNPHKNERDAGSDIPEYEEKYKENYKEIKELSNNRDLIGSAPADSLFLIPESGFLNPDSQQQPVKKNFDLEFKKFWDIYPKRPGANKAAALKAWNARLKKGVTVEEMQRGAFRYRQCCEAMNIEPQFIKQPSTFLGPDEHYLADWTPRINRNKSKAQENKDFLQDLTGDNHERRDLRTIPMAGESDSETLD